MGTYSYLILTSARNLVKQTLKKPALLIVYIALFGFIVFNLSTMPENAMNNGGALPNMWKALALIYFAAQFYIVFRGALTKGTTVFGMDDVQLLFTAPVNMQSVLLYGVFRQMGKSLLIPLVLLFQIPNLRNLLGMGRSEIIALFAAMFLMAFVAQVSAMSIYALLAENSPARRRTMQVLNVLAAAFIAACAYSFATGGLDAAIGLLCGGAWGYIPLVGWLRAAVAAAEAGSALTCALLLAASLVIALIPLYLVWKKQPDFYEDVLDVTAERHEIKQLAQSGNKQEQAVRGMKVRVGRRGLGRGNGATAFFHKNLLEQRRMGVAFFDMWTLINVGTVVAMCYFMGRSGMGDAAEGASVMAYISLATLVYMQMIFNVSTGQYTVEKKRPYLIVTPCSPRFKLVMCNLAGALKAALDALLAFFIASLVAPVHPIHAPLAALLCGLFSMLFVGAQLLADWLVGDKHSRLLGMMLFFVAAFLLVVPATVLFVVMMGMGLIAAYLSAAAYAALAIVVLYIPLGSILHNMNMND